MLWEITDGTLHIGQYRAITWGILVLFLGRWLVQRSAFLRNYNIPEPVVGGLLCSLALTLVYFIFGISVEFDLEGRDVLLVYFFTTIGLNARLSDLLAGGKPLAILLSATVGYMVIQNLTGISVAAMFDQPSDTLQHLIDHDARAEDRYVVLAVDNLHPVGVGP